MKLSFLFVFIITSLFNFPAYSNIIVFVDMNKLISTSKPGLFLMKQLDSIKKYTTRKHDTNIFVKDSKGDQSVREYVMGCKTINKLSEIIPCFVKTLGRVPDGIVYTNVKGLSLSEMLKNGMGFHTWLNIFFQLMIALEIAQRLSNFTHYDLHAGNVMISKQIKNNYSVDIDNTTYTINSGYLPVIIDFGTTTVAVAGRCVGSYDYTNSGVFYFVMPGHDMYRLMISSYCSASDTRTKNGILELFKFFSEYETLYVHSDEEIRIVNKEFCSGLISSKAASLTPMMMISYIQKEYTDIISKCIQIKHKCVIKNKSLLIGKYNSEMLNNVFNLVLPDKDTLIKTRCKLLELPLRYRNSSVKEKLNTDFNELLGYQKLVEPYIMILYTILELNLERYYSLWIKRFYKSDIFIFYSENKIANDRATRWGDTLLASIMVY